MKQIFIKTGKVAAAVVIFSAAILTGCEKEEFLEEQPLAASQEMQAAGAKQNFVPNEVLIKFKAGASEKGRAAALAHIGGHVKEKILTKMMERFGDREGWVLVHTPMAALEAIGKMKGAAEIEFAEPNYIYQHCATSTDTYYTKGSLWGMYGSRTKPANKYGSGAATAWAAGHTGAASVVVGIIDEGFQYTHPDLSGQVWTNPYDPFDGLDNDGNGYVDDVHGWDFDGNNCGVYDGGTTGNLDDHGTHVAGTIGARSNGSGVVGINWKVTMISCKFMGRDGGTTANAVKAVDYLTDLKTRHGMNIVASNNSWGGGGYSQALYDAVKRANSKEILFVAAAGNGGSDNAGDNNDAVASYPSGIDLPNVIAVAAITSSGTKSSFSNYGAKTVDIGAPGSGIYSTTAYKTYSSYSGTSMAAPHVTGGVALYASRHPGATAATIKAALMSSAIPTSSLSGKCVSGGRLNLSGF
ncbi:S8 family serine peptidase [Pontibacter sp. 172403-2]|uniref:S8 family peptidase n=1 Tax=Pontibacter rufus TaxID=2791028 RepID=UPI0018AFB13A|nr:S8 family peptidase [Pontibacter sp. 172403-2]MBF9254724.1 S8 family serine peptidase [Pontibacter sp. 172403-2]